MANNVNVKKLEADLWESADLLRAGSKLTSNQYCMPVLGLIFLRYPRDGIVTEILVSNEEMVEFGKGLVRIK